MTNLLLSKETEKRLKLLFPPKEQDLVRTELLEECSNTLLGLEDVDGTTLYRLHFAVLKLSNGDFNKFRMAIQLAKTDLRDLLMAAGFGENVVAHELWLPTKNWG
jgi:hypothetical protein